MANSDIETIKKGLADINTFVKDRFDPATKEMDVLKEESARLKREVAEAAAARAGGPARCPDGAGGGSGVSVRPGGGLCGDVSARPRAGAADRPLAAQRVVRAGVDGEGRRGPAPRDRRDQPGLDPGVLSGRREEAPAVAYGGLQADRSVRGVQPGDARLDD